MTPCRAILYALLAALPAVSLSAAEVGASNNLGLEVPPDFEVSLFAGDDLAHDIYSMTVDAEGRVVVSGPGYIKILHDDDGDGRADRAQLYSKLPAGGAHGMAFTGNQLICTGDNAVLRFVDANGDGQADGDPQSWAALNNPEHGANGVVQGPDGCFYIVCGNDAGVNEKFISSEHSPVRHPRCGAVVRFSPDGQRREVLAQGFRNPYDLDFGPGGQMFTVDSDNERDFHLPWYAPTRLFDVAQGMEHGWLESGWQRSWNRPESFFDSGPRLAEIGRGSPTGLVCYRHRQFPEKYQGGIFSACWTLGRIYYFPLKAESAESKSASVQTHCETFLQTTGDGGFAPCDLAVAPSGDLLVAIGGRGTRGSVYRVRYTGAAEPTKPANEVEKVLAADQPLAAWSRARWEPIADKLRRHVFVAAALTTKLPLQQRVRAIEVLRERFGGLTDAEARLIVRLKQPALTARVAWDLAHGDYDPSAMKLLIEMTHDKDPLVLRAAWEALATADDVDWHPWGRPDFWRAFHSGDRRVRSAAIRAAQMAGRKSYESQSEERNRSQAPMLYFDPLAHLRITAADPDQRRIFKDDELTACLALLGDTKTVETQLEACRLLQIGLGDVGQRQGRPEVFSGYQTRQPIALPPENVQALVKVLADGLATPDAELRRERARALGILAAEHAGVYSALAAQWTDNSTTEDEIHYLIVASLVGGTRSAADTAATAVALLRLESKLRKRDQYPSQNWPQRVGELFAELCRHDPALAERLVADPDFGRPEHTLYADRLKAELRAEATRKLLAAQLQSGEPLSSELVKLVGELPAIESRPVLDAAWSQMGLRDAIVLALARKPLPQDRPHLVAGLAAVQQPVVEAAARALISQAGAGSPEELSAAMRALVQAGQTPKGVTDPKLIARLLKHWVADDDTPAADENDPAVLLAAWRNWFSEAHPEQARRLAVSAGQDWPAWQERLEKIDWAQGVAERGRGVFESRACHRCHQATGQLGPGLEGTARRLSRDDLFIAIVDPNREVSPAYLATSVVTPGGQVYLGRVVYDSPEGLLLQTGPDTIVRITGSEKGAQRPSRQSLMPTGLLNGASDQELADLYAFLKTLGKR